MTKRVGWYIGKKENTFPAPPPSVMFSEPVKREQNPFHALARHICLMQDSHYPNCQKGKNNTNRRFCFIPGKNWELMPVDEILLKRSSQQQKQKGNRKRLKNFGKSSGRTTVPSPVGHFALTAAATTCGGSWKFGASEMIRDIEHARLTHSTRRAWKIGFIGCSDRFIDELWMHGFQRFERFQQPWVTWGLPLLYSAYTFFYHQKVV